jgi:hypothetical protein
MFTRKIGKFLRGNATPFQIISATILGALSAALPGFAQAPLLFVSLFFLVLMLNANLFIAGLTFLATKLLYLLLLPVYFSVGVGLVEGPFNGLVAALANAPVFAWFGWEYYVTLPALIVHLLVGLLIGMLINGALSRFRAKMAHLESGSEAYARYTAKLPVKLFAWLLLGGLKGKQSWQELSAVKKGGLPVRPVGIVFVIGLTIIGYVGIQLLDETIVTQYTRSAMERANGATVDLASVVIDAASNKITLNGIAAADPDELTTNRFAADSIVLELSGMSLLAKKVALDRVEVLGAAVGSARTLPGKLTQPRPEEPRQEREWEDLPLEDYLANAQKWRDRLASVKRIYDQLAPYLDKEEAVEEATDEPQLSWRDRLAQRAEEEGYARISSDTVIRASPRLLVRALVADPIRVAGESAQSFQLTASNISTHPTLVEQPGEILLNRADGQLQLRLQLPSAERPSASQVEIAMQGLSVDAMAEETGGKLPLSGGTIAFKGSGAIDNALLDLPLEVVIRDSSLAAAGQTLPVRELPLTVRVYGPLERPRIALPKDALENALKEGGKRQIQNLIEDKAGDSLKRMLPFGGGD